MSLGQPVALAVFHQIDGAEDAQRYRDDRRDGDHDRRADEPIEKAAAFPTEAERLGTGEELPAHGRQTPPGDLEQDHDHRDEREHQTDGDERRVPAVAPHPPPAGPRPAQGRSPARASAGPTFRGESLGTACDIRDLRRPDSGPGCQVGAHTRLNRHTMARAAMLMMMVMTKSTTPIPTSASDAVAGGLCEGVRDRRRPWCSRDERWRDRSWPPTRPTEPPRWSPRGPGPDPAWPPPRCPPGSGQH